MLMALCDRVVVQPATDDTQKQNMRSEYILDGTNSTRGQVRTLLLAYGIDINMQDRFVLLQSRTVQIIRKGPVQLLLFCEKIIGTHDMRASIERICEQESMYQLQLDEVEVSLEHTVIRRQLLEPKVRDYQAWLRLEANFLATRHVHFLKQIIAKEYTVTAAESAYKTLVQAEVEAMLCSEGFDDQTQKTKQKLRTAKRKAAHAASALEKMQDKIHKAKCLKRKLNVQQKRQQQILDESSTGLAQAAKARDKASSEASKAEHKIDEVTAEILALEATLSAAVEAGQKKRSSHKNLAQIEALEAELKQLEHRLGTTNLDQYQTQLETTRKRSAELDTSCIAVQRSLVALRESNDGASRDIDEHATVLNVASSALAPLQQELSSLDRQYNKSLSTIRTLKELWSSGKASRIRAAVHELSSKHGISADNNHSFLIIHS